MVLFLVKIMEFFNRTRVILVIFLVKTVEYQLKRGMEV